MEVAIILRELWQRRLLVGVVVVAAVAIGGLTAYRPGFPPQSRRYTVGVASARALVDTPKSQLVDLGLSQDSSNSGVLPARAALLADLMTSSPLKDETARRAGVPSDRLEMPADPQASGGGSTPVGSSPAAPDAVAFKLSAQADETLPLIVVTTQAPDAKQAARLADSALTVLSGYLRALTADADVPRDRRLVLQRLGQARFGVEERGPSRVMAVGVAIVMFGLGCGAILLVLALARSWRAVSDATDAGPPPVPAAYPALEHRGADAPPGPDAAWAAADVDEALPWPSSSAQGGRGR